MLLHWSRDYRPNLGWSLGGSPGSVKSFPDKLSLILVPGSGLFPSTPYLLRVLILPWSPGVREYHPESGLFSGLLWGQDNLPRFSGLSCARKHTPDSSKLGEKIPALRRMPHSGIYSSRQCRARIFLGSARDKFK